jgi:hypothetical protein
MKPRHDLGVLIVIEIVVDVPFVEIGRVRDCVTCRCRNFFCRNCHLELGSEPPENPALVRRVSSGGLAFTGEETWSSLPNSD